MTKKNLSLFIGLILIIGIAYFLGQQFIKQKPAPLSDSSSTVKPSPAIDDINLTIDGKKVLGLPPGQEKGQIQKLKIANSISPDWKPNLEKSIRAQGGNNVKEINIKKVDSFVWTQDGIALYVESVIVSVTNQKNEVTSFKALVDAQNGKVLKNWDQPVFDPLHPRENFKVKIDPRYHNE